MPFIPVAVNKTGPPGNTGPTGIGNTTQYDLVSQGGCVGNGVADDTAAFNAAIVAAGSSRVLISPPGKTYLISSALIVGVAGSRIDLRGSTIMKADGGNFVAVYVSAGGTTLENFAVDGRRSHSDTKGPGVYHEANSALPAVIRNVTVTSCGGDGFSGGSYGAQNLSYENCTANDNVDSSFAYNASGFIPVGTAHYENCVSTRNDRDGYTVYQYAGQATFSGTNYASGNSRHGFFLNNNGSNSGGRAEMLVAYNNRANGVELDAPDWHIDYVSSTLNGTATGGNYPSGDGANPSATGFNMLGALRLVAGTICCLGNPGYGVTFTSASCDNTIGTVLVDNTGAGDGDPGLHFSGGSCRNSVGTYTARGPTYGIIIGEGISGSNDYNFVGTAYIYGCGYGALRIDRGTYNHIGRIVSRNSYTTYAGQGLLEFESANTSNNVVGFLDHKIISGTKPAYVVHFDADAVANYVMDGFGGGASDYITAQVLDSNGGNFVSPVLATVGSLRT